MSHAPHRVHYTFADYLSLEEASTVKHEYLDGQIYAMAGGTPEHSALKVAVITELGAQLKGGRCRVLDSDLRIRVLSSGLATYPDASVVCGPWQLDPDDKNSVVNPVVILEVTSKSTEQYDRTDKAEHYRLIPTLQEFVLVSHRAREIEVHRRGTDGGWSSTIARGGERVELRSIACALDVNAVYEAASEPTA